MKGRDAIFVEIFKLFHTAILIALQNLSTEITNQNIIPIKLLY